MICHELSLVVLLHMRPSQARRLDDIRKSSVSPSRVIITPSRASYVYTFRDRPTAPHTHAADERASHGISVDDARGMGHRPHALQRLQMVNLDESSVR